jgi:hypothetical protein
MKRPPTRFEAAISLALAFLLCCLCSSAWAQGLVDPGRNLPIEAVEVRLVNPSADAALNTRLEDLVRRTLAAFPSDRYARERVAASLARARRSPDIADISHTADFGPTGGVVLRIAVTLADGAAGAGPRGALTERGAKDFPLLYDADGTLLLARVETLGMLYGNRDAWYGRPDLMLAGNPFAVGKPAGEGSSGWLEGFLHVGVYGITPLTDTVHVYAGLSGVASGSVGRELFTDQTRSFFGLEDAFAGIVGGSTSDAGDRFVYAVLAGRQRFTVGDGMLITNTAANGLNRAALQSNPRWAGDMVFVAKAAYNDIRGEVFHIDPDEMPEVDSQTRIQGVNVETRALGQVDLGLSALRVPKSSFGYFTTTGTYSREGLRVLDARLRWQPAPAGSNGPFLAAEVARQTHSRFDMRAWAVAGEAGYVFADSAWAPTISYRFAHFSGDDASTARFERWDPLLSGGNGETWVQGINHFKVFQNSNLVAHRVQARLRPTPKVELVPQLWLFRADSTTNLGGNPALSFLPSKDLGTEINMTAKHFVSRNVMLQGHVAATFAGSAVKDALGPSSSPWVSTMLFLRIGF